MRLNGIRGGVLVLRLIRTLLLIGFSLAISTSGDVGRFDFTLKAVERGGCASTLVNGVALRMCNAG